MFHHRFDTPASTMVVLQWFLLSFNGGAINSGGLLATGNFVSHVTGFATLFGVSAAQQQLQVAIGMVTVPVFFLAGAFLSGFLIDRPISMNRRPRFSWVMGLACLCLILAALCGRQLTHGEFGAEELRIKDSYVLLALLCLASGLQNGAITSSSGGSVRSTHMTGLTTDLGLGLARIFTFNLSDERILKERRANSLRVGSILSFIAGSMTGALIFIQLGFSGFLLPATILAYFAWLGRKA